MKTRDQQELEEILKVKKTDIAAMLVTVQRDAYEREQKLKAQVAILNAELVGQGRVLKLLESMAGEANLGLKIQR